MNKVRRKKLDEVRNLLHLAQGLLEDAKKEEQEALDNMPESLQGCARAEEMESYIELMDEASNYLARARFTVGGI